MEDYSTGGCLFRREVLAIFSSMQAMRLFQHDASYFLALQYRRLRETCGVGCLVLTLGGRSASDDVVVVSFESYLTRFCVRSDWNSVGRSIQKLLTGRLQKRSAAAQPKLHFSAQLVLLTRLQRIKPLQRSQTGTRSASWRRTPSTSWRSPSTT